MPPNSDPETTAASPLARSTVPVGGIFLVSGPIGNLGDITLRAIETLRECDLIACEDTRHSLRLLERCQIGRKTTISYHEHNEASRTPELIQRALNGEKVAILTDAGSPSISDPGFRVAKAAREAGVPLTVLPGPSAVLTALIGSGLPTDSFYFGGFLPVKSGRRERELSEALARPHTSVYFESPHRLVKSLNVLASLAPERPICVSRELTKKFETYHHGNAAEVAAEFTRLPAVKGEITLVIQGAGRQSRSAADRREP
ncbi:MAG: 16S rRNA (cytidine(1402)-2'-O)-methyltransferase [Verrucomicrobiae bacterium]|nr:16S rRNA (cytidine(1402)-2'-O)-methyltransferase [Verrucomicrobiae bacterium]